MKERMALIRRESEEIDLARAKLLSPRAKINVTVDRYTSLYISYNIIITLP